MTSTATTSAAVHLVTIADTFPVRSTEVKLSSTGLATAPALQRAVHTYRERHGYTDPDGPRPLPEWLVAHLGAPPHWRHIRRWSALAEQAALWREQHTVTDPTTLLGDQPGDAADAARWRELNAEVDEFHADVLAADAPKPWTYWALLWSMSMVGLFVVGVVLTRFEPFKPRRFDQVDTFSFLAQISATMLTWAPMLAAVLLAFGMPTVSGRVIVERFAVQGEVTATLHTLRTALDAALVGLALVAQAAMVLAGVLVGLVAVGVVAEHQQFVGVL